MRIAISGASSAGKTSIVQMLREIFSIPEIPELVSTMASAYSVQSLRELHIGQQIKVQRELFQEKIHLESTIPNFVSDRSIVDYLTFWFLRCMPFVPQAESERMIELVKKHAFIYDHIFLLPFQPEYFARDPKRHENILTHIRFEILLKGLYSYLGIGFHQIRAARLEEMETDIERIVRSI